MANNMSKAKTKNKNVKQYYAQKYQEAQYLQQNGHLNKAEKLYLELLKDFPEHPDCLHYLGLIYFQKGNLQKAEDNFKKSIKSNNNPTYLSNFALLANHQKKHDEAIKLLLEAVRLKPDYSEAWFNLGCTYSETGDMQASEDAYLKAIDSNNNYIKALFNLACVQESLGKSNEAKLTIDRITNLKPDSTNLYYTLGLALSRLNIKDNTTKAIEYFSKAISDNPDSIETYRALASLYIESNSVEKALELYERIVPNEPDYQELNLEYAHCLVKTGKTRKAENIFNDILNNNHDDLVALNGIATINRYAGKFSEAEDIYKKILDKDKNNINAYYGYSKCRKFTNDDEETINQLEIVINDKPGYLGYFTLGKIYNDLKIYDKAIEYYRKANNIRDIKINFDKTEHTNRVNSIIEVFNTEFVDQFKQYGVQSDLPVFILGTPRSGTTLIEQIISSHSRVYGAGELDYIKQIAYEKPVNSNLLKSYPERMNGLTGSIIDRDASIYLEEINKLMADNEIIRITDKMPGNFMYIGYIFIMFPNAKIIHAQRNPVDTCLSIYFQNFNSGHKYAFNLENLVFWYKEYIRLMKHWKTMYGEKILDVNYDDVVNDSEKSAKRMIEYCDLEWEEQCVSFHESKRTIHTSSNWQVKQPIYKTSQQRWRKYEDFIPELIDGLSELM